MNRQYFTNSTRLIIIHLKEYNFKLCRKGLLERAKGMKISFGEFKKIENMYLDKSLRLATDEEGQKVLLKEVKGEKMNGMDKEIDALSTALRTIQRTIDNIKNDVNSRTSGRIYDMWWNRINNISKQFKSLYSDMNNGLYDYTYKMSRIQDNAWNKVINDIGWIKDNVFVEVDDISAIIEGFEEGDLANLFSQESQNKSLKRSAGCRSTDDPIKPGDFKKAKMDENGKTNESPEVIRTVEGKKKERGGKSSVILDDISSDEGEGEIIDEVGEIDIKGFSDLIGKHLK